jgi:hypothetical protein
MRSSWPGRRIQLEKRSGRDATYCSTVCADSRGQVRIEWDGSSLVRWNHDAARMAAALPPARHTSEGPIPGPCHDAVVTLPLVPGTLILSRNVKAADLFLPQEVALFVAVDEVDHRGWRVAHPVKDVSIHTDVSAQRSTVILSYWDDTPDRTVDGGVDVEVHTIAKQV